VKDRIFVLIALLALLAYSPIQDRGPAQVYAGEALAILITCQGEVLVHRDGEAIKGTFGMQLNDGDEIQTGTGASADIMFQNGNVIQIAGGSKMLVKESRPTPGAAAPRASVGDQGFQTVQNFIKLKDREGSSSMARLRSGDKIPEIRAESPSQTRIRDGHPTFRWSASKAITELRLTVYNEEGVHWEYDINAVSSVEYPADAAVLVPGVSYSWAVETTDPLQFPPLRSANAFFEVLASEDAMALATALSQTDKQEMPSQSAYHLVRASLFYNYQLMGDAITETRQAVALDSDNPILQSILAHLYAEAGLTDEAIEAYDRLLEKR
jgi:hypothetical protein